MESSTPPPPPPSSSSSSCRSHVHIHSWIVHPIDNRAASVRIPTHPSIADGCRRVTCTAQRLAGVATAGLQLPVHRLRPIRAGRHGRSAARAPGATHSHGHAVFIGDTTVRGPSLVRGLGVQVWASTRAQHLKQQHSHSKLDTDPALIHDDLVCVVTDPLQSRLDSSDTTVVFSERYWLESGEHPNNPCTISVGHRPRGVLAPWTRRRRSPDPSGTGGVPGRGRGRTRPPRDR